MVVRLAGMDSITVVSSATEAIEWSGLTRRNLNVSEHVRLAQFRNHRAEREFVAGHLIARTLVSLITDMRADEVSLIQQCPHCGGPHGQIHVADSNAVVSLSHTYGVVAVSVARQEGLGVDIERCDRNTLSVTAHGLAFHPDEQLAILKHASPSAQAVAFWTQKEALIKAGIAPAGPLNSWSACATLAQAPTWKKRDICIRRMGSSYALALVSAGNSANLPGYQLRRSGGRLALVESWPAQSVAQPVPIIGVDDLPGGHCDDLAYP